MKKDYCLEDPLRCIDAQVPQDEQGKLGDPCSSDDECAGALRLSCIDGVCGFPADLVEGDPCLVTEECGAGLYCSSGDTSSKCMPAGTGEAGVRCDATGDCERGLICAFDGGLVKHCVESGAGDLGAACDGIADCLAGLVCRAPQPGEPSSCAAFDPQALPSVVWEGLVCPPDRDEAVAYFEVPRGDGDDADFFRLPFPNDVRRSGDGLDLSGFPSPGDHLGTGVDFVGEYVRAAEQDLSGFATNPVVYFRFSQPYGAVGRESVLLYDLTDGTPEYGRPLSRSWGVSSGKVTRYVCENWLNVRTGAGSPLLPGHTYAVILTHGLETRDGAPFARDADLEALLADATPGDATLAKAHAAYAPLRTFLAQGGGEAQLALADVLNAAVFTTQEPERTVAALRSAVQAQPAPVTKDVTVCGEGVTSPCDDGGERTCGDPPDGYVEIHGRIALPIFQQGQAPYLTGGAIELDGDGMPTLQRREDVCFGLLVPEAAPPEGGHPLVIYAHGTGGSFTSGLGELGSAAATASAAVLTFDLPQHGSRKNGSTRGSDELFYNFANPRAARDNVAQGSADLFALVQWAHSANEQASGPFGRELRFDGARIALFGHSQGATHASLALPHEPGVLGAVLSGVGGDLSEALTRKSAPLDIAAALPIVLGDPEAGAEGSCRNCIGAHHPALALLQSYFERVDPVNFARALHTPPEGESAKHLFMTYGIADSYTPEASQQAYALAAELDVVGPLQSESWKPEVVAAPLAGNVQSGELTVTQGVRQYQPESGEDGHFVYLGPAQDDWQRFLAALLRGEQPTIGE